MLAHATLGQATQGTIFSGGMSHVYNDVPVWGVVISARCDISNNKAPVYYYLPVVKWEDFKKVELPNIIVESAINSVRKSLKKALEKANLSASILEVKLSPEELDVLINGVPTKSQRDALKKNFEHLRNLEKCNRNQDSLLALCKDTFNTIFSDLAENKNASYYLIEDKEAGVLVVRLRELHRISPKFMQSLGGGIQVPFEEPSTVQSEISTLAEGDLYMPLYKMESPYMEHLIQRYVYQFDRIGVEDFDLGLLTF